MLFHKTEHDQNCFLVWWRPWQEHINTAAKILSVAGCKSFAFKCGRSYGKASPPSTTSPTREAQRSPGCVALPGVCIGVCTLPGVCIRSSAGPSPAALHPQWLLLRGAQGGWMGSHGAPSLLQSAPAPACSKTAPHSITLLFPRLLQTSSHLHILIACQELLLQTTSSLTAHPGKASFKQRRH